MPKRAITNLRFPHGGYCKRYAFQAQPPYTSPDCLNVWPDGPVRVRERGGSRPGTGKAYYTQLGSAGNREVRLLSEVTYITTDGFTAWTDDFMGDALGDVWTAASWVGTAPSVIDDGLSEVSYDEDVAAMRDAISDLDTSESYVVEMFITPYQAEHHGTYELYARMTGNTGTSMPTDGVVAALTLGGSTGTYSGTLKVYAAEAETHSYDFATGNTTAAQGGWFTMLVNGDDITCYWRGITLTSQTVTTQTGERLGFGINCTSEGGICLVDTFRVQYYADSDGRVYRRRLVASAGGKLYRETWLGQLEEVSSSLTLASDRQLHAAEYLQKLYIADYGDPAVEETSVTVSATELSKGGVDWDASGCDANDHVAVVTAGTGTVANGTYTIASVAAGTLTLDTSIGSGTCSVRVERGAKVYDPSANTLALWTADSGKGAVPTGRPYIARYHDRLFMAGGKVSPHTWECSRQGDADDWLDSEDEADVARPIAGASSEAGRIARPVTALIPFSDDYLIFGQEGECWVLRGDPAYGGMIDSMSYTVGPLHEDAWCHGPAGELIMQTTDGCYIVLPGPNQFPQSVSRELLPNEMLDIDTGQTEVCVEYDIRHRGVFIFLTPQAAVERQHYWLDWESKTWWPIELPSDHEPFSVHRYRAEVPEESTVLLGCRDGYVRRFCRRFESDDSTEIESYVEYGPIRLGGDDLRHGSIDELVVTLAEGSGTVTGSVYVADTHEALQSASAAATKTLSAGRNYTWRPRRSGGSFLLRLENAATNRAWAVENVAAVIQRRGYQRL